MSKENPPLKKAAMDALGERGITVEKIADLVYFLQEKYIDDLDRKTCVYNVQKVLEKREVHNAILTGITLDKMGEEGKMDEPLLSIIQQDASLYGIDEVIALSIVNIYGSIGFTNYGYIDKVKPGILKDLDKHADGQCHTFLDDILGAIAAAASSRLAHEAESIEEDLDLD